jgi:hypothetical protein
VCPELCDGRSCAVGLQHRNHAVLLDEIATR